VFVVSENEYTMILDLPIEARNLNAQRAHKEEVPSFATVKIKGMGRELFKTYLLKAFSGIKLVLDLEGISKDYEFILNDYFKKNPQKVVLPLNSNISFVEVVYPNKIKISLDKFSSKKVPIISNLSIKAASGYVLVGKGKLYPSEIEIAGPEEELELINHIETEYDTLHGLINSVENTLKLKSLGKLINYSHNKIKFKLNIQQISERIIVDIPVKIISVPQKIRAFPSPQTVSLTVIGGMTRIANLDPKEIIISVNFNEWNIQKQFYEPKVIIPSDLLEWRDLSPRNIEVAVAREIQ
jgi:YbbR domain-containing protein